MIFPHIVPIFCKFVNNIHPACQIGKGFIYLVEMLIHILTITLNFEIIGWCCGLRLMHFAFPGLSIVPPRVPLDELPGSPWAERLEWAHNSSSRSSVWWPKRSSRSAIKTMRSLASWSTVATPSAAVACQWYWGAWTKILEPSNNGKGYLGIVGWPRIASNVACRTSVPTSSTWCGCTTWGTIWPDPSPPFPPFCIWRHYGKQWA